MYLYPLFVVVVVVVESSGKDSLLLKMQIVKNFLYCLVHDSNLSNSKCTIWTANDYDIF